MSIIINGRYRYKTHSNQPIGVLKHHFFGTKEVLIQWEDPNLIPQEERYPEHLFFNNNTFEYLGMHTHQASLPSGWQFVSPSTPAPEKSGCSHEWAMYRGFNEDYEFCKKCDEKRQNATK